MAYFVIAFSHLAWCFQSSYMSQHVSVLHSFTSPNNILLYTAKSLQSCPTLCDPRDGSRPGSPVPGILQARTLEWVAISFSNAWKWKVKVKTLSRARLLATPWTAAYQAPLSLGFSRQEYWSGLPLPSPIHYIFLFHLKSILFFYVWFSKLVCVTFWTSNEREIIFPNTEIEKCRLNAGMVMLIYTVRFKLLDYVRLEM